MNKGAESIKSAKPSFDTVKRTTNCYKCCVVIVIEGKESLLEGEPFLSQKDPPYANI